MSIIRKGFIRGGRVELVGPNDLPEGSEVAVAPWIAGPDDGPVSAEEIARVLAAMHRLEPLDIPGEVGADLDAWERELNRRGIERDATDAGDASW